MPTGQVRADMYSKTNIAGETNTLVHPSKETINTILRLGHGTLLFTLCLFVFLGWLNRDTPGNPYGRIWALILAHFFGGRAGNAGVGLEIGFHPAFLMYQAFVQDFILMCYLYPVFVKGHDLLFKVPIVGKRAYQFHELAVRRRNQIRPYGVVGLFLFVVFPFWSTGPIVGILVGHLLGLRAVTSFTTVVVADALATAAWMWAYDSLREINQTLAYFVLAGVLILSLASVVAARFSWPRKQGNDDKVMAASVETPPAPRTEHA